MNPEAHYDREILETILAETRALRHSSQTALDRFQHEYEEAIGQVTAQLKSLEARLQAIEDHRRALGETVRVSRDPEEEMPQAT